MEKQKRQGFTLVELTIVILILGILITVATLNYIDVRRVFWEQIAISNLKVMKTATQLYMSDHNGNFPTKLISSTGANDALDYYLEDELRSVIENPEEPYKYSLKLQNDKYILSVKGPNSFSEQIVIIR